ncbi:glycosyltransferase family 2 protein [Pseudomonas sp. EL_65y_Pfl2_R95]|uniref:glycosyltransferase family 2 protein n=1 Tax=Pseudomonas sp. EL_65y_Pfl2_R95 TaxID=3088698 RepID=UPI0030DBE91F
MKVSVAAVVVLYYPELDVLRRLLCSIVGQVEHVFVIDNTPGGTADSYLNIMGDQSITYQPLHDNYGIAHAHNAGVTLARRSEKTHVLILDQDSELAPNTVKTLIDESLKLIQMGKKVGAIGPVFIDEKTNEAAPAIKSTFFGGKRSSVNLDSIEPVLASYIISSGSLISIDVLDHVGGMSDELFIDWVDIEWCERAAGLGYASYLTPLVSMRHSIGDEFVNFLGRKINLHSDFRNYFIVRNAVYLALWGKVSLSTRFQLARKVPIYIFVYSLFSKRKFYSLKLLVLACYDGLVKKMFKGRF